MNETELKERRELNAKYTEAIERVKETLIEKISAKGYSCTPQQAGFARSGVITTIKRDGADATSLIDVDRDCSTYFPVGLPTSIKIIVKRDTRPVTYRVDGLEWDTFNWDKIIETHLKEVEFQMEKRLKISAEYRAKQERESLEDAEVPTVPELSDRVNYAYNPTCFTRKRNADGTYDVMLRIEKVSAQTAIALRDVVITNKKEAAPLS